MYLKWLVASFATLAFFPLFADDSKPELDNSATHELVVPRGRNPFWSSIGGKDSVYFVRPMEFGAEIVRVGVKTKKNIVEVWHKTDDLTKDPSYLRVDDKEEFVYWVEGGVLMRKKIEGEKNKVEALTASLPGAFQELVVKENRLYFLLKIKSDKKSQDSSPANPQSYNKILYELSLDGKSTPKKLYETNNDEEKYIDIRSLDFQEKVRIVTHGYSSRKAGEFVEWTPDKLYQVLTFDAQGKQESEEKAGDKLAGLFSHPFQGFEFYVGGKVFEEKGRRFYTQVPYKWDPKTQKLNELILPPKVAVQGMPFSQRGFVYFVAREFDVLPVKMFLYRYNLKSDSFDAKYPLPTEPGKMIPANGKDVYWLDFNKGLYKTTLP